ARNTQLKIDEKAYCTEMVLVGEGDKGREWLKKEYFSSSVIESGNVIRCVYLKGKVY
nr:hypothetical protein [Tanacetum cinerariifolium]